MLESFRTCAELFERSTCPAILECELSDLGWASTDGRSERLLLVLNDRFFKGCIFRHSLIHSFIFICVLIGVTSNVSSRSFTLRLLLKSKLLLDATLLTAAFVVVGADK